MIRTRCHLVFAGLWSVMKIVHAMTAYLVFFFLLFLHISRHTDNVDSKRGLFSDASHTHISRKEDWDGQQRKSSDCPYKVTAGVRGSRESSSSRRPCTLARTDGPELVRSMCYLSRSSFFFIDREKCNLRSRPLSDWDVISGGAVSSRDFVSLAVGNK